jgi:hypothetical protein
MGQMGLDQRRSTKWERPNQALDPRLRRLMRGMDDPSRLQRDVEQSVISVETAPAPGEQLEPSQLTTRVLVRMSSTEPLGAMPDVRWIRAVEGIYACEVPLPQPQRLAALPQVDFVEACSFPRSTRRWPRRTPTGSTVRRPTCPGSPEPGW